jgi:hypothetical protein
MWNLEALKESKHPGSLWDTREPLSQSMIQVERDFDLFLGVPERRDMSNGATIK